jgi:hypothetical protein
MISGTLMVSTSIPLCQPASSFCSAASVLLTVAVQATLSSPVTVFELAFNVVMNKCSLTPAGTGTVPFDGDLAALCNLRNACCAGSHYEPLYSGDEL